MKKFTLAMAAVIGLFVGTRADAALRLDFANIPNTEIQSTGTGADSTLSFTNNAGGFSFDITGSIGGTGDSVGLFGTITGGFKYLSGDIQDLGPIQTANLTSVGTTQLLISDGVNTLSGDISGINVSTFGGGATINFTSSVNLTNVVYSGPNADLNQLKNEVNAGGAITKITFQFSSNVTLTDLLNGTNTSSYSGVIATIPEPGSLAMAFTGVTMLGLSCYRQHRRKQG